MAITVATPGLREVNVARACPVLSVFELDGARMPKFVERVMLASGSPCPARLTTTVIVAVALGEIGLGLAVTLAEKGTGRILKLALEDASPLDRAVKVVAPEFFALIGEYA